MSYARLQLDFEKVVNSGVEYIMSTIVDQIITTPAPLKSCLVVAPGDAGVAERILRVAGYAELITTPLDALPSTVSLFSSASLPTVPTGIQVGDVITLGAIPFVWSQFFGTLAYSGTVTTVNSSTEVVMDTAFPMFARNLTFTVYRASVAQLSGATDGVANRDYTGLSGSVFLAPAHYDTWSTLDDAENKFTSLRAEAQSIVDALNEDAYTGTFEELYT